MNKNFLIAVLVAIAIIAIGGYYFPQIRQFGSGTRFINGLSTTSTAPSAGQVLTTSLTVNAASTLTGTTTIAQSPDGFIVWDDFTVATGTAKAVYTNSYGPMICSGYGGSLYVNSTGFSQTLVFGLGTSTSATGFSNNLLASTTIATSTDEVRNLLANTFVLATGESIVGAISDVYNTASSTYNSNWTVEFSIPCHLLGS